MLSLQSQFRSLASCLNSCLRWNRNFHSNTSPLWFQFSPMVCAEPLRKKKRVDPTVLREKAEKKIRRIQRDIRRLEKVARQYKPIAELELPKKVIRDTERVRSTVTLSEAERQEEAELKQFWAVYKRKQHLAEMRAIQRVTSAQERALDALEETSPELYEEALQLDLVLLPFRRTGPVETPAIQDFDYPEGDFVDVTKVYQPIVPLDVKRQRQLGLHKKK